MKEEEEVSRGEESDGRMEESDEESEDEEEENEDEEDDVTDLIKALGLTQFLEVGDAGRLAPDHPRRAVAGLTLVRVAGTDVRKREDADAAFAAAAAAGDAVELVFRRKIAFSQHPKYLGVTLDPQLLMNRQAARVQVEAKRRVGALRALAGTTWGCSKATLRMVYCGYVRGAMEYAADSIFAFLKKTAKEGLERVQLDAARVITGCTRDSKAEVVLWEAGVPPLELRAKMKAGAQLTKAESLPDGVPLKEVARERTEKGWLGFARKALQEAQLDTVEFEPWLTQPLQAAGVEHGPHTFCSNLGLDGAAVPKAKTPEARRAFDARREALQLAWWLFTDGSAQEGVRNGGSGYVLKSWPDEVESKSGRCASGRWSSSYRAEAVALRQGLRMVRANIALLGGAQVLAVGTDSQSLIDRLRSGPAAQTGRTLAEIWEELRLLWREHGVRVHVEWTPGHTGVDGNERADTLANEGSALPQNAVPVDQDTGRMALRKAMRETWRETLEGDGESLRRYRTVLAAGAVREATLGGRGEERVLCQLRAGESPICRGTLGKYQAKSGATYRRCPRCRGGVETVDHLLFKCKATSRFRFCAWGDEVADVTWLARQPDRIVRFVQRGKFLEEAREQTRQAGLMRPRKRRQ